MAVRDEYKENSFQKSQAGFEPKFVWDKKSLPEAGTVNDVNRLIDKDVAGELISKMKNRKPTRS